MKKIALVLVLFMYISFNMLYASSSYKIGNINIRIFEDSASEREPHFIKGLSPEIAANFKNIKIKMHVNVLLASVDGKNYLFDVGYGRNAIKDMALNGINPDDIDAIFISHLHGDHIDGLVVDGKRTFTNAKVYINEDELNFWTSDKNINDANYSELSSRFVNVKNKLQPYLSDIITFNVDDKLTHLNEIVPHISPVNLKGHTPGHMGYIISDGDDKLFFIGDLYHYLGIQLHSADVYTTFDIDSKKAIETRTNILE